MKILQLTSDWKWTGPAAPMVALVLGLRARGHQVELVCAEPDEGTSPSLLARAHEAGVPASLTLSRSRGVRWRRDAADVARLRALVDEGDFDVVHTWHTRDHVLALRATAARRRAGKTQIVRSYKRAEPICALPWNRWLFGPGSDGLVCVSPQAARRNAHLRPGLPILGVLGAVDLERFRPAEPPAATRESLGLEDGHRVLGIVARAQRHRRFDLLLKAMALVVADDPSARLLVVGRGTHIRETAEEPARRLGIADRVVFAGYRGDDYVDVLRCMDVFTLLVPGSDGGCRALLEAHACGLPAVSTRRGALPEILHDGETGLIIAERPEALAGAWRRLLDDPMRRRAMAHAARTRAEKLFAPERLAQAVEQHYREVRGTGE